MASLGALVGVGSSCIRLVFNLWFKSNKRIGYFFCWGPSAETEVCFFLKLHDAPIQIEYERCSDATTSVEFDWDLRIWEYRDMFFLLRNDDIYLLLTNLNLPLNFLSFQIFISNMATFTWFYTDIYIYIIYSLSSIPVFQTRAYTYNFWQLSIAVPASITLDLRASRFVPVSMLEAVVPWTWEHGGTNVLMQWQWCSIISFLGWGRGGIVVSFQGLFTIRTGYEIFMISWRLAIQLLQQLSTCTQALVPFRYGIWIFVHFWKPFVTCFVGLIFESFKFSWFFLV